MANKKLQAVFENPEFIKKDQPQIKIISFDESKEDEVIAFSSINPAIPTWGYYHIKQFSSKLVTKPELVFDLHLDSKRIAIAILIDTFKNKNNNAQLEFIGIDEHYNSYQIYKIVIQKAKEMLPKNRSGFEITLHEASKEIEALVIQENFVKNYEIFEISANTENFKYSDNFENIKLLSEADYYKVYQILYDTLNENPEVNLLNYEDWKEVYHELSNNYIFVYEEEGEIIGFVQMTINTDENSGDVKFLRVLPGSRRKGIGKKLLCFSLHYFAEKGIKVCHAVVTTYNEAALKMDLNLGFKIIDHYNVYIWKPKF